MAHLKVGTGAWVVVCDGRKALILENKGDDAYPDLRTVEHREQEVPKTSELGTDAPGRSYSSVGHGRSAVEETDLHLEVEHAFLSAIAKRLDKAVLDRETRHLVVVAPPRALGFLRKAFSPHVKGAILAEIDKDLVAMPVSEIEAHLFGKRT
ncbi:MAG TPA: host attachment protein [Bauldia sp.]|nr:host attachment protein [Bauldia sp.]